MRFRDADSPQSARAGQDVPLQVNFVACKQTNYHMFNAALDDAHPLLPKMPSFVVDIVKTTSRSAKIMHATQALLRQKDAELETRANLLYKAKA